jgi:Amino acid synthesis
MPDVQIRKLALALEEIWHEGGPPAAIPRRRAAMLAAIHNPFAGRYVADIQPFMEDLKPLGMMMAGRLLAAFGGDAALIDGYGKGALIGEAGELEHGALWHAPGGYAMREVLGGADGRASAIVPSTKKVCGVGGRLDVPVTHIQASYVRSHFDGMEVGMPDGPRADEMVLVLVMTTGPRVHDRAGGLAAGDVKGVDGLR